MELTPPAAVSGKVLDEDGDLMPGCMVSLRSANARPQFQPEDSRLADGSFRLFHIPPGTWRVSARCLTPVFQPRPLSAGPDPLPRLAYPTQYLPQPLRLTGGTETSGIEIRMKPVPVTYIRLSLGPSAQARKDLSYELSPVNAEEQNGFAFGWRPLDTSHSPVILPQVFPGSYDLRIVSGAFGARGVDTPGPPMISTQRLVVGDQPVDARADLRTTFDLTGRIEFDDGVIPPSFDWSHVSICINPNFAIPFDRNDCSKAQPDGVFTLNVFPMLSHIFVDAPHAYMKSAWYGNREVSGGQIDLSAGPAELRVVLSTKTATIEGSAPPGVMVWIAPSNPSNERPQRPAPADRDGHYRSTVLRPGSID